MAIFMDRLVGIEVGLEISIKFRARYEDIDRGMLLELGGLELGGGALKFKSSEKDEGLALIDPYKVRKYCYTLSFWMIIRL